MLINSIVVLALVIANGFFVASEFALVKVREGDLKALANQGSPKAKRVQYILKHLDTYLSSCQLGITLASLGLGWVGEPMVAQSLAPFLRLLEVPVEWDHYIAFPVAFTAITFLHITLGEQVPKIYAIAKYRSISLQIAHLLYWFTKIFKPFIYCLNVISNSMLRIIGFNTDELHSHSTTEADLRLLVLESKEGGHVTQNEQRMIENILDLNDKIARRYALPRHLITFLNTENSIAENLRLAAQSKHTRLPLCDGDVDQCLGIIHVKDVFQLMAEGTAINDLRALARPVSVLPEKTRLEKLLAHFKKSKRHFALLVDEFGSISGMITLENILEEVVGVIQDEFDQEADPISWISDKEALVLGSCPIERISKLFQVTLKKNTSDTVSGYLTELIQSVPDVGESIKDGELEFQIIEVENHSVQKMKIIKTTINPN
ncbi:hemolysin family protein [Coraliomargarita sp. W4R53]